MPSYDSSLQEIKDRIDIVDLVSDYVNLKKAGQNWKGLCPFHTEKTPSFTVSPAKQIFHCFGCGTGGDIFTFLVRYDNLTFPEALNILAKKAGVTLQRSEKSVAKKGEKETLLTIHNDALHFFQQNLSPHTRAQSYLEERGLGRDVRKIFSLGYAPKSWNALLNYLMRKGHKPESIKKAGLAVQGSKGYYDTFRDRVIFPIYDLKGDVIAFGGRSIDGSEPKYLNSPETLIFNKSRVLYGLDRAKESIKHDGYALFMEGYTDVITAHVYGFSTAVAPLGTAFTPEHGKLIKRFTEDVILVFDSDQAGIKAAKKAANILFEAGLNVKVLSFPDKEDPDGFLKKNGRDAFGRLLEHPLTIIDFLIKHGENKRVIAREAIETIAIITDRVLRGEYVRKLSEQLDVNELFVLEELKRIKRQLRSGYGKQDRKAVPKPGKRPVNEVYIIKLLLQLPEKAGDIMEMLHAEDFGDAVLQGIFQKMKNGLTGFHGLLAECEGEEKDVLTGISLCDNFDDPEKALTDCIKRLKDNRRTILLQELQGRIRGAERNKNFELLRQLQLEQQELLKTRGR